MFSTFREIITDHIRFDRQIFGLAMADQKNRYSGTKLGWIWALVRPAIRIGVYYFGFAIGLRGGQPVNGYPYFLWLLTGLILWMYAGGMFTGGASCLRQYRFLVTKIRFPLDLIPTFVNLSAFFMHMVLTVVMCLIFVGMGFMPTLYWLQLPLYSLLMFIFFCEWGLLTGIYATMSKDFLMALRSISMAMFWISGVFFDIGKMSMGHQLVKNILLMNPIALGIRGFRNSMIYGVWFWEDKDILRFLIVLLVTGILACRSYKRFGREIPDFL